MTSSLPIPPSTPIPRIPVRDLIVTTHVTMATWQMLARYRCLVPLTSEVARRATTRPSPALRAAALVIESGHPTWAVIGAISALWVYHPAAATLVREADHPFHPGVVTLVPRPGAQHSARPLPDGVCALPTAPLKRYDIQTVAYLGSEPVPVTTPTRTALDIALLNRLVTDTMRHRALLELVRVGADLPAARARLTTPNLHLPAARIARAADALALAESTIRRHGWQPESWQADAAA